LKLMRPCCSTRGTGVSFDGTIVTIEAQMRLRDMGSV
jgi:hypothetical protein